MNTANYAFCFVFLALSFTPPAAQEGKVIVVNVDSKDLKRTAYRLRIPVERVKNAREALQEATDLARRVRPNQTNSISQLGKLKQGFLLVAELREKEKDPGTKTGRGTARSDPDQLEKALVSESAIDNFDLAMRYVRSIPDEPTRLSMLIAVVARCRRPY